MRAHEEILHQVIRHNGGYCEISLLPQQHLLLVTARLPGPLDQPLCTSLLLRTNTEGKIESPGTPLWHQDYTAESTPGGLSEAHAHIIARVQAGELP